MTKKTSKTSNAPATETKAPVTASTYRFVLPKETKARAQTYIVPKGPMGKERWLAKANYNVVTEGDKLVVILTAAQHDYWAKDGITGMTPVEAKAE